MTDLEILFDQKANAEQRLKALEKLPIPSGSDGDWVNNHIHTTYSFSPYTPSAAVYYAMKAGLSTAGIMDHDSVGGINEFIEAGRILNMPVTVGFECRTSVKGSPFEGRRLNNPDQNSVAYVTMHGIPHQNVSMCEKVLSPLREKRNDRNKKMINKINDICEPYGYSIDFDLDVLPISMYHDGGSITERHILFALTRKIAIGNTREKTISVLEKLCGTLSEKNKEKLFNAPEEYYLYDILGILKSSLVKKIYVDADEELMHITDYVKFAKEVGAISAYAYLGDVGESPTGDKAAQKFEDDYLEDLFIYLKEIGFNAITYMPSRNTKEQLERVMSLCDKYGFFQISGEDINSPRQSFTCPAMQSYPQLYTATYALIGHETEATKDASLAMFSDYSVEKMPELLKRIEYYAEIGRRI